MSVSSRGEGMGYMWQEWCCGGLHAGTADSPEEALKGLDEFIRAGCPDCFDEAACGCGSGDPYGDCRDCDA